MNANFLLPVSIDKWLIQATAQLRQADILTARLDALVLLGDELRRDKAWVLAHPEQQLSPEQLQDLGKKLVQRIKRTPLAYIRGSQEFFGREFTVNPDVLIPRPETEALIEQLLALRPQAGDILADIGTGSGAIAITTKLELPAVEVLAIDSSASALAVAQKNATKFGAEVTFKQQDLLKKPLPKPVRFLLANLPYVARSWQRSAETNSEPELALFADDDGLALIKKLIQQSVGKVVPEGYLLLEADPRQHQAIVTYAAGHHYGLVSIRDYAIVFTNSDKHPA